MKASICSCTKGDRTTFRKLESNNTFYECMNCGRLYNKFESYSELLKLDDEEIIQFIRECNIEVVGNIKDKTLNVGKIESDLSCLRNRLQDKINGYETYWGSYCGGIVNFDYGIGIIKKLIIDIKNLKEIIEIIENE